MLLLGGLLAFYRSQNPTALYVKKSIKYYLYYGNPLSSSDEQSGLGTVEEEILYVNHQMTDEVDIMGDNKRIYYTEDVTRLVNYNDGYQMDFPSDAQFVFDYSPIYTDVYTDLYHARVSYEYAPYQSMDDIKGQKINDISPFFSPMDNGVQTYIEYYFNRFLTSESFAEANRVEVEPTIWMEADGGQVEIIHATIQDLPDDLCDGYTYVIFTDDSRYFHRILFKYHSEDSETVRDEILAMIESYQRIETFGEASYNIEYTPQIPDYWSKETLALYEKLVNQDYVDFGIFASDVYNTGVYETIPAIEEAVDYTFPVVLCYLHFGNEFPMEFLQENYDHGRIVEFTYQVTAYNNWDLEGYTPQMDIYRGELDEEIRLLAQQFKEFGHPILFRLNNEMNSDWTSYSGVINMSDPEIYQAVYQRFYTIFEEEGVDNCIWIYNPNDNNYPPANWNNFLAYFPGEEYIQLLGVTGYNTGTYYAELNGERWREFDEIYSDVEGCYLPFFSEYPWIITEFASSSVGGDKVEWIANMFDSLSDFENIKIAVWFSAGDYADPEEETILARPYFLDETPEILEAFREGIQKMLGE